MTKNYTTTKNDQGLREQVCCFIHENPHSSLRNVADGLGKDKFRSSISARINELLMSNIILVSGKTLCPVSGQEVNTYEFNHGTPIPLPPKRASRKELEDENTKLKQQLSNARDLILYFKNHSLQSQFMIEQFYKKE